MAIGPVQMLVLGFEGDHFTGEIAAELDRLKDSDTIRLIDLLFVNKGDDGAVTVLQATQLDQEEAMEFGALVGALIGLGADGEEGAEAGAIAGAEALEDGHVFDESQAWYVADTIPNGTSAAIVLPGYAADEVRCRRPELPQVLIGGYRFPTRTTSRGDTWIPAGRR